MFRAYDAGRERLVAVKLFKLDLPPERVHKLVAAFEQLIASELSHPAMAVPLATGIADVSAYLAQDYVAAESLDLAVREYGAAPIADALRVAAQLAGALDFAALVNVAHGALHPRDVLLSSDETRLTGIGVARALESVGVAAPIRRPYTAPERVAGGRWDRRADVFSLAALIHELLWARRIPGTGEHTAGSLSELPGADLAVLQSVFSRALAEDPTARYDTALEFVEALKMAFPGVAIEKPEQPTARSRQGSSSHPPVVAAGRSGVTSRQTPPQTTEIDAAGQHPDPLDDRQPAARETREPRLPLEPPIVAPPMPVGPTPPVPFNPDAVDLRAAEAARFEDAATTPVVPVAQEMPVRREEPITIDENPPISLIEDSRSAVWPLVASLLIGLALGFAGGYGVGTRERPAAVASTPVETPPPAPTPPSGSASGREATEVAIPSAPQPEQTAGAPRQETKPAPSPVAPRASRADAETGRSAAGRHAAKVEKPKPQTARVAQPEKPPAAPSATTGRYQGVLDVDSRPTGARVFLDGRLVGTTPLVMQSVPAGEHAIRLERDGYRRWSSSVRVVAAEQNRVTASLER